MRRLLFILFILINLGNGFLLDGKSIPVKIFLVDNTWLKADLMNSDRQGNLTVRLKDKNEYILRRQDFRLVQLPRPPEILQAEALFKQNKFREAGELLAPIAAKYNFPPLQAEIRVLQAQLKMAAADYRAVVSILRPLLEQQMVEPQVEAVVYARAFLLLGKAYAELDRNDDAAQAYRNSFELAVPEYSAPANLALGKMLLAQQKTQGALDCFLENISVFETRTPGRRISMQETIALYKKLGNENYQYYEQMLKAEYPENSQ
ncbi:MAG: hypothetical protein PHH77_10105 [Victivallaceae bacterium]|nr:hypothetical protein [Victivallaceae bacterium]